MSLYTVTITPDDPALAVTTIRLDVTATAATIHELRLVPGAAGGLTPGELPVLDMNQLVTAVVAALGPGSRTAGPATPGRVSDAAKPRKAPAKTAARSRPAQTKPAAKKAAKKSAKTATAGKNASGRLQAKKTTAKKAVPPVETGGRSYRRAPNDLDAVLRQAGGRASVVAEHYGVPRHTAYGWIRGRKKAEAAA